jgi:DNA-binding protein YbaB
MVGRMPGQMRAELETMLDEYRSLLTRLDRLKAEVAALTATARSSDGCVTATVNAHGELAGLTIDPALARRLDLSALTTRILQAAGAAAVEVRQRTSAAVSQFLPPGLRRLVGPDGDPTRLIGRLAGSPTHDAFRGGL